MLIRFSTNCAVQCPVQESRSRIGDTVLHNALASLRPNSMHRKCKLQSPQSTGNYSARENHEGGAPNGLVHGYRSGNMDPGDVLC